MPRLKLLTLSAILAGSCALAQNSLDAGHIRDAEERMAQNLCIQALQPLKYVSDAGRLTPGYLLTAGRANDCAGEKQQAITCYEKYLVLVPGNDSVGKRLAVLKNGGGTSKVQAEQAEANNLYKRAKKGFGRPVVSERDGAFGLCYDRATGGSQAPYAWGASIFVASVSTFARNKAAFELIPSFGYAGGGQHSWFADVFGTTPADVTKVLGTVHGDLQIALSYLPINTDKKALAVGATVGCHAMLMNGIDRVSGGDGYSVPFLTSPIAGGKVTLYPGRHFYIAVSYLNFFRSRYRNELQYFTTLTPVDESRIRISIGTRGF